MRNPIALTKIFGIEIRVGLSLMIVSGAILLSLGRYYFPSTYPEFSTPDIWKLTIAVATSLFLSIATHEPGHSPVSALLGAQRKLQASKAYTID